MMRLYEAIRRHESHRVRVSVRVLEKTTNDGNVIGGKPQRTFLQRWRYFLITRYRKKFPRQEFSSANKTYRSQCVHHSGLAKELNASSFDLAVLHWLGDKTMSIEEIGKLRIPYAWHLHDMWLFSGADHTSTDRRYVTGYSKGSRPVDESGPDINREVFLRKTRHWRKPRQLFTPSNWLAEETRDSPLTRKWPVTVIPNPVDTDFWVPSDPLQARRLLGIDPSATVFLFGASGGANAVHKGADLFFDALHILASTHHNHPVISQTHILLFGKPGGVPGDLPFPLTQLGPVDDEQLKLAYGAATVVVVPSRVESFGQVASEAHACGRPVVATRAGGLVDIISDGETGKLIDPESSEQLADAMKWAVESPHRIEKLGMMARHRAQGLWSAQTVAEKYVTLLLQQVPESIS